MWRQGDDPVDQKNNPEANIVAIDYDPGSTKVNQENRIRLMLSNAREKLRQEQKKRNPKKADSQNQQLTRK